MAADREVVAELLAAIPRSAVPVALDDRRDGWRFIIAPPSGRLPRWVSRARIVRLALADVREAKEEISQGARVSTVSGHLWTITGRRITGHLCAAEVRPGDDGRFLFSLPIPETDRSGLARHPDLQQVSEQDLRALTGSLRRATPPSGDDGPLNLVFGRQGSAF